MSLGSTKLLLMQNDLRWNAISSDQLLMTSKFCKVLVYHFSAWQCVAILSVNLTNGDLPNEMLDLILG